MLILIASVMLVLLVSGSRVNGYEDYEDFTEEDNVDDYINYDVVDEEEPASTSGIADEDDEVKSNRNRRDQDDEEEGINTTTRDDDEEQGVHNSKATLNPEDFAEVKGALNRLLSGISAENLFTPYSTLPSIDHRPSVELNITSTTPSYRIQETSTETEGVTHNISREEDTMTSTLKQITDENYHEYWPTRSSKLDRFSAFKDGEYLLRKASTKTTNATTAKTGKTPQMDIAKLLGIISGLADDFESNLTRKLNETIESLDIPTCTTPTPPTMETTVTDEYDANYTGAIIAKCFVCGLDIPGIPQHAHCADAFAGDFLPLVPVDTSAKGKISRFRKYCKYANIAGYRTKESQPRVIIGRWTGGCSVRWIDLSGVYTQRACRNRMQPTMGLHFASKRMAKLEKALWNIENGCIISPVATLTPLSRGISLYARFHACVCTGNWCNSAGVYAPLYWTLLIDLLSVIL